jgi:hypothetical protein
VRRHHGRRRRRQPRAGRRRRGRGQRLHARRRRRELLGHGGLRQRPAGEGLAVAPGQGARRRDDPAAGAELQLCHVPVQLGGPRGGPHPLLQPRVPLPRERQVQERHRQVACPGEHDLPHLPQDSSPRVAVEGAAAAVAGAVGFSGATNAGVVVGVGGESAADIIPGIGGAVAGVGGSITAVIAVEIHDRASIQRPVSDSLDKLLERLRFV